MTELVRTEILESGVAILRLHNPPMNALSNELLDELAAAATRVGSDPATKVVVLFGGEKAFAAGADISNFGSVAQGEAVAKAFRGACDAIAGIPRVVIAGVRRYALGGGCEIALTADIRIAADDVRFGQPEILLGVIPGAGGTQRLPRLIGVGRAKELVMTGRQVDAEEALRIGLVNRVVPADSLESATLEFAETLARGAVEAMGRAKHCIDKGLDGSLEDGLDLEGEYFANVFATEDAAIGIESFRTNGPGKANFVGR